jgi:hypothetical protein
MIALTPQLRICAKLEFARWELSQKLGKTNAPTIALDIKHDTPLFPGSERFLRRS